MRLVTAYQPKVVISAFIIINAIVLLSVAFLPFIDLPNHLAEAAIYKYYHDADNALANYYQPTPWYYPNTFHTVFCTFFPTVEIGNKIFHILYIALLQISLYLVIRRLNGNLWYGLLGILFTYNYNLTFGFVGFAIAIPTTILLFYFTLLDIEQNRLYLKALIALTLIMLFLMHAQMALFGLVLYGAMMLYHYWNSWKKLIAHGVLIPLPVILVIFYWWYTRATTTEESTAEYLLFYYTTRFFQDFYTRFGLVAYDNFPLLKGMAGIILAAAFFALLFIPLFYYKSWRNLNKGVLRHANLLYALLFLLASAGCYFILPDKLPGQSPLYQRFCTIVILAFIIVGSILLKDIKTRFIATLSILAVVVYTTLWTEYIITFNRQTQHFSKDMFNGIDNESRLAGVIYENKFRGRQLYIHYPNYFLVWTKGIVASKIIDYRFGVVRRRVPETVIPFYHEYIGDGEQPDPLPQYDNLEYLLVKGAIPPQPYVNFDRFTLHRESGEWKLYKNISVLEESKQVVNTKLYD